MEAPATPCRLCQKPCTLIKYEAICVTCYSDRLKAQADKFIERPKFWKKPSK